MNKKLLTFLFPAIAVFLSACSSNSGEQATDSSDSSTSLTVNDSTAVSADTDTTRMIRLNCFDLPEDKSNQLGQVLYISYGKYIGEAGMDVLKHYLTHKVFDTSRMESYVDRGHLKQRYFFYIYNNLPLFVNRKERHSGYYIDANQSVGEEEKLISYALYRFDRSPENLRRTFDLVKNELRTYISTETYEALAINRTLHSLRDTYKYIHTLDNADARLDSVYLAVDSVAANFDYDAPTAYGHSLDSDYEIYKRYLNVGQYDDANPDSYESLWAFSFWVRRHHEKNEAEVISIVNELVEIFER